MNTRRNIMKLLGISPVVGQSAMVELAKKIDNPVLAAASSLQTVAPGSPGKSPAERLLGKTLADEINQLLKVARHEREAMKAIRSASGGLDPDINCLRSVALTYKTRKQRERDYKEEMLIRKAGDLTWW